jgi:hypothetical protein
VRGEIAIGGTTRRQLLVRGTFAAIAAALPVARDLARSTPAAADPADPLFALAEATMAAFADTMIPGRPAQVTNLGNPIPAGAIAGVDSRPGAVECDVVALYESPLVGFEALVPVFLVDLELRSLAHGGAFLDLDFEARTAVANDGLAYDNATRLIWVAAAAVPFLAIAGGEAPGDTSATDLGLQLLGYPGAAPAGYPDNSYGVRLAAERTATGSLP